MFRTWIDRTLVSAALLLVLQAGSTQAQYIHFESPPVHPLELSPDSSELYAVHTADHRLVVFDLSGPEPVRIAEIPVGLEPVTVRARTVDELWVVNHISDSISIIDLSLGNVVATLRVGDEPTDVVFAGNPQRAFVCLSQEDRIAVYDPTQLDAPPVSIPLEGSDPRSLAVSPDENRVYVSIHESGNHTTVVPFETVAANGGPPTPDPPMKAGLPAAPSTGLIVQHDGTTWRDGAGGDWGPQIGYQLMDNDVIVIDSTSLNVIDDYRGVGTTLFNLAVNPADGTVYASNQEAFNEVRFEPVLKGRFLQNRVTRIGVGGSSIEPVHLNPHIDYADEAGSAGERALSLSIPLDMVVSGTTGEVFVAAFGSAKVGVLDGNANVLRRIPVGEGPAGLALDEASETLYVLNHIDGSISAVDLVDDSSIELSLGFDPTPVNVREGRRLFYDGENSSAHGDLSCASCHVFTGLDNIAWDLGNPLGDMIPVPAAGNPLGILPDFHPMKGPMTTQTLKGIEGTEPLHWRGDRGLLSDFNGAFVALMGRATSLSGDDFQLFEDFLFSVAYPSNPFRDLDGSLPNQLNGASPSNGETLYLTGDLVGGADCVSCHSLPTGENGLIIPGNLLNEAEGKIVPQLRNMYEKTRFDSEAAFNVRGFGFTHDGAVDDLFTFLDFPAFDFASDQQQRDVESFLLAFDTGTHPAIGAQYTFDGVADGPGVNILGTLEMLADASDIGLIAKGKLFPGQPRGWLYEGGGIWSSDKSSESSITTPQLLALAGFETQITVTGVVEGTQHRLAIDRDDDGFRDADELDGGADPGDPASIPSGVVTGIDGAIAAAGPSLWLTGPNPTGSAARLAFRAASAGQVSLEVYDARGRRVKTLHRSSVGSSEQHSVSWDLRDDRGIAVTSGVYFVRLSAEGTSRTRRVAVVR